jgi:hypothetical protein
MRGGHYAVRADIASADKDSDSCYIIAMLSLLLTNAAIDGGDLLMIRRREFITGLGGAVASST